MSVKVVSLTIVPLRSCAVPVVNRKWCGCLSFTPKVANTLVKCWGSFYCVRVVFTGVLRKSPGFEFACMPNKQQVGKRGGST